MRTAFIAVAAIVLCHSAADALSLRVSPVMIDVQAPASAAQITLRNDHDVALDVQLRVFKWVQDKNGDRLEPTDDVVVSPPMTTLNPNVEYVVRVIRVSRTPPTREESYRLLVDELPDLARRRNGTVSFVVRQSIPVFFAGAQGTPRVSWSVQQAGKSYVVSASNNGSKRLRVSKLTLTNGKGVPLAQRPGLVGYVLAGSEVSWSIPAHKAAPMAGRLGLTAESEAEPIDVEPAARALR
jgi:fimbrial chaperone protein